MYRQEADNNEFKVLEKVGEYMGSCAAGLARGRKGHLFKFNSNIDVGRLGTGSRGSFHLRGL